MSSLRSSRHSLGGLTLLRGSRVVFFGPLIFPTVMAWLPHPPRLSVEPGHKIQPMIPYLPRAFLVWPGFPHPRFRYLFLALAIHGAVIEAVQAIPALHRDSDWRDWLADIAAVLAVLAIARLIRLRRMKRNGPVPGRDG